MKELFGLIKFSLAVTAPTWFVFLMAFLGMTVQNLKLTGISEPMIAILWIIFILGCFYWYSVIINVTYKITQIWWLTTIVAIIYIPFALFFGFFAGWAGLLAGGGGY